MKIAWKILISILIIAWLGFIAFQGPSMLSMGHSEGRCAASTMQGLSCPMVLAAFDFINFHAKALAELSTATFSSLGISQILLTLFVILTALVFAEKFLRKFLSEYSQQLRKSFLYSWLQKHFETIFPISQISLFNWLATQKLIPSIV